MTRIELAAPRRRPGFTLIELLVVLLIIGILIGLLVPAIAAAVRRARSAAVQAEINQLAQALADFKNKFGDYPPSRIVLSENGALASGTTLNSSNGGVSPDLTIAQLNLRTTIAFRKFWPRVLLPNPNNSSSNGWYDYDGNGVMSTTQILLQGQECLVFFLGGIPVPNVDSTTGATTGILGMSGFGKSPTNPFSNNLPNALGMYNANRNAPLFEFNTSRLLANPPSSVTAPGMPYYLDSINAGANQNNGGSFNPAGFYAYFSTNNGSGYDPNDVNLAETDTLGNMPLTLGFETNQGVTPSHSPNPYTSNFPSITPITGTQPSPQYLTPQSFQIISSGIDGVFGIGGIYNAASTSGTALPDESAIASTTDRTIERDNLTNFRNSTLD